MTAVLLALALAAVLPAGGQHFDPQALYGYIDGGAELFLEFGFVSLEVQPAAGGLVVESYHMIDSTAALGVYLAKCGVERPWPEVVARNTGTPHQLMAAGGSLFLIVRNAGGDEAARAGMARIANEALAQEPKLPVLRLWEFLPTSGRETGSEFLARGRFAIETFFTFGEGDVLQLEGGGALGAGARYEDGARRLVVVYPAPTGAAAALANLRANLDPYLKVVADSPAALTFADYSGKFGRVALVEDRLEIVVGLAEAPGP
jgi:hypothetical protein